jgi:hypothetical protein
VLADKHIFNPFFASASHEIRFMGLCFGAMVMTNRFLVFRMWVDFKAGAFWYFRVYKEQEIE